MGVTSKRVLLFLMLLVPSSVNAADEPEEEPMTEDQVIPGLELPPIDGLKQTSVDRTIEANDTSKTNEERVVLGAKSLGMEEAFMSGVQQGMELLFLRDYPAARSHFLSLEERYPDTAVGSIGQVLIWQVLMVENFDFKYEKQYQVAKKSAMSQLKKLKKTPGNDAWEELMLAGMAGIDAIHSMRRENYLSALSGAFAAMEHIAEAQALAPDFPDLKLADGMYHYWRTVITMSSKKLPDYGDSRAQGIEEMLYARDNGVFLAVPASLALTYTWLEERKFKLAIAEGERSQEGYPDNVINNLVVGRTYIARRNYKAALEEFDHVMAISPENTRVHYYRAIALYRTKDLEASEASLKTYLASDYLEESHEAAAYFRLGKIYFVQNKLDEAEVEYKKAVKLTGHGGAKAGLGYIKKRRKAAKG